MHHHSQNLKKKKKKKFPPSPQFDGKIGSFEHFAK